MNKNLMDLKTIYEEDRVKDAAQVTGLGCWGDGRASSWERDTERWASSSPLSFSILWSNVFCVLLSISLSHLWFPCNCGEQGPVLWQNPTSSFCLTAFSGIGEVHLTGKGRPQKYLKLPFPGNNLQLKGAGSWWIIQTDKSESQWQWLLVYVHSDYQSVMSFINFSPSLTIPAPSVLIPGK